jgi:hypothetical protein
MLLLESSHGLASLKYGTEVYVIGISFFGNTIFQAVNKSRIGVLVIVTLSLTKILHMHTQVKWTLNIMSFGPSVESLPSPDDRLPKTVMVLPCDFTAVCHDSKTKNRLDKVSLISKKI